MKKLLCALISICMVLAAGVVPTILAAEQESVRVFYQGEQIIFDVQPEIINEYTMVPARTIFETMGAKVDWDEETETVTVKKKKKSISMTIGGLVVNQKDEIIDTDVAPVVVNDRTLVPLRVIAEFLGAEVVWDETSQTVYINDKEKYVDESWKENTGTINISTNELTGSGVLSNENIITITEGGDFEVFGETQNGMILVDADDRVKLRLSGTSITNQNGPAIFFKNVDKGFITLTEGTVNTLTDSANYDYDDASAALYCDEDLEIKGSGFLTINANYKHGIASDDDISIENGNIAITSAVKDGIHAKSGIKISGGTIDITANGDGIQSTKWNVTISGGDVNIKTTGEVLSSQSNMMGRGFETSQVIVEADDIASSKGIKAQENLYINDGTVDIHSTGHSIHSSDIIEINGGSMNIYSEDGKGITAHGNLTINAGDIAIEYSYEGIESKAELVINGGDISVYATDDGINAGGGDSMRGGQMQGDRKNMQKPDGTQGEQIQGDRQNMQKPDGTQGEQMQGERQNMQKSDGTQGEQMQGDRQNMQKSDGTQGEQMQGDRQNMQKSDNFDGASQSNRDNNGHSITINNGNIYINASGDGIDSNGNLSINSGNIIIDGPENGGDSALDSDGAMLINGGYVVAVGSVGMLELPSTNSNQNSLVAISNDFIEAGTNITIIDASGNIILTYTPQKTYQGIIFSSPILQTGENYSVKFGTTDIGSAIISDTLAQIGSSTRGKGRF